MNIKACIFDLDGVLVHTANLHYIAWHRLASSLGAAFTNQQNEELKGVSRVESLRLILHWAGIELPEEEFAEMLATKNQWYLDMIAGFTENDVKAGVLPFLNLLRDSGVSITLGSSSMNANLILEKIGIRSYFDAIFDGHSVVNGKPAPDIFLKSSNHLKIDPSEAIIFEDSYKGIEAALSGGFYAVGVGKHKNLSRAHVVIPSFKDLDWHRLLSQLPKYPIK